MQDNSTRHLQSIAGEAGCTSFRAKRALHIDLCTKGGAANLAEVCAAVHLKPDTVKRYSRQFGIKLADYDPYANQDKPAPAGKKRLPMTRLRMN